MDTERNEIGTDNSTQLRSFNSWLAELDVTATTGWRWRKRGIVHTVNICGRLYITAAEAANFSRRAVAGEFAISFKPSNRSASASHSTSIETP